MAGKVGPFAPPKIIQNGHLMTLLQQMLDQSGTQKAGATGYNNAFLHGVARSTTTSSTPDAVRVNSTVSPVFTVMHGSSSKPWP